uniref:Uncharacterized protein n=1 Tax=Oryzias melastigma TaxID=30732 RepID=A0A3B3B7V4_ORYME
MRTPSSLTHNNWCRGEGVEVSHALMAIGISEEAPIDAIELALETIKVLGKVRVRGKMFDPESNTVTVLCECREEIDSQRVPTELLLDEEGSKWTLVTARTETRFDPFSEKLDKFLQDEGKTLDDVRQLYSPALSENQNSESVVRALGNLMQSTKANENSPFRRLRTFSGVHPTPPGEDNLDNWVEQAKFMVEEYDFTDREEKRRIIESLRGPALEIIQAVRMSHPDARHMDYIQVLESTFGTVESGEELYLTFRALHQKSNECLSDFLLRLERTLNKVVQKGGLKVSEVNKARLEQLIKGETESDILLLQLNLRERQSDPPSFLNLLKEIREEEEHELARQKLKKPSKQYVRTVQTTETEPEKDHSMDLQNEVRETSMKKEKGDNLSIDARHVSRGAERGERETARSCYEHRAEGRRLDCGCGV